MFLLTYMHQNIKNIKNIKKYIYIYIYIKHSPKCSGLGAFENDAPTPRSQVTLDLSDADQVLKNKQSCRQSKVTWERERKRGARAGAPFLEAFVPEHFGERLYIYIYIYFIFFIF